jgi:hypothetical protein
MIGASVQYFAGSFIIQPFGCMERSIVWFAWGIYVRDLAPQGRSHLRLECLQPFSKLRCWKRLRRMLDLVHQFHIGDESETSLAKIVSKPIDVTQMNSLSYDPDRPGIAMTFRETDSIGPQINKAPTRGTSDGVIVYKAYRSMDHAIAS